MSDQAQDLPQPAQGLLSSYLAYHLCISRGQITRPQGFPEQDEGLESTIYVLGYLFIMAQSAIKTSTLTWNDFEYGTGSKGFFSETTSLQIPWTEPPAVEKGQEGSG